MAKFIQHWLFLIYCRLWSKKRYSWFNFKEAQKITGIDKLLKLSKAFSLMKSSGWIKVRKSKENTRKREYRIVEIELILKELSK